MNIEIKLPSDLVEPLKRITSVDLSRVDFSLYHPKLVTLLTTSKLDPHWIEPFLIEMTTQYSDLYDEICTCLDTQSDAIPILIFNEESCSVAVIFSHPDLETPEPGEPGSILATVRAFGLYEDFLCSDCEGHLSCSSCAVEVLGGTLKNPIPREEEFDMLDIDKAKPPTDCTRLGCQSIIGTTPLVLLVRRSDPDALRAAIQAEKAQKKQSKS